MPPPPPSPTLKNILLINLKPPYELKPSTLRMGAPEKTGGVKQLIIHENEKLLLVDLDSKEEEEESQYVSPYDSDTEDDEEDGVVQAKPAEKEEEALDKAGNADTEKSKTSAQESGNSAAAATTAGGNEGDSENPPAQGDAQAETSKEDDFENSKHVTKMPLTVEAFTELYQASHTVIVPDSLFAKESRIFHNGSFQSFGMIPLQEFYKAGGTVIVLAIEGMLLGTITDKINELFGTEWRVEFQEPCSVQLTTEGLDLFGPFAPKQPALKGLPSFLSCNPKSEGLYVKRMGTKEEFIIEFHAQDEVFERLGIEKDESMDCFNPEKSYVNYVERYTDRYVIAMHQGVGDAKGRIVWYGDRDNSATMAFVFCKFLNMGPPPGLLQEQQPMSGTRDMAGNAADVDVEGGDRNLFHNDEGKEEDDTGIVATLLWYLGWR